MVDVTRTFRVNQHADTVIEYLMDFAHAVDWDPGTQSCTRLDSGPIAVGSRWKNVSKVLGKQTELTYRLDQFERNRLVFVGENKTATSTDEISVESRGDSSEITYHAHIEFNGLAKLAGPVMKVEFERLGNETVKQLTQTLEAL